MGYDDLENHTGPLAANSTEPTRNAAFVIGVALVTGIGLAALLLNQSDTSHRSLDSSTSGFVINALYLNGLLAIIGLASSLAGFFHPSIPYGPAGRRPDLFGVATVVAIIGALAATLDAEKFMWMVPFHIGIVVAAMIGTLRVAEFQKRMWGLPEKMPPRTGPT